MGADLSRVRFDPLRDLAGVVLQQGRLLLDADWNELVAIIERRVRASIADLDSPGPQPGIAGVAVVPRTTPEAFKVTLAAGAMTIGRGRMYVDGLLAENHGIGDLVFDRLLSEQQRDTDTPVDKQPWAPVPDPGLPTTGTHLAYLDVWQREVTYVEQPDLVDPAIGVDTTARTQTAWQVRLHELKQAGVTCTTPDADIPGWNDLIAPSPSRLTVVTDPATADTDPCTLPPTGDYRGRENQTYRVEIHEGGVAGTATFKWSRDNGSVVSPVVEVLSGGTSLRPASLGRDTVLGFDKGDWVEVLDDERELRQLPGDVRKIDDVADGKIFFLTALSADLRLAGDPARDRHLRIRRWDQNGQVRTSTGSVITDLNQASASGVIKVPTGASTRVVLENGITVSLTAGGGSFRTGDHWIFAARVADSSVEELDEAPPLGPHHHFARLGVVSFPGTESDCRTLWPPECDCDGEGGCSDCAVCVTPESHASGQLTIQDAVDLVTKSGGTVCLAAGSYQLDEGGVVIDGAKSVTVRGQGPASVVISRERGFRVQGSAFVTLQDFAVISNSAAAAVYSERTVAATYQRLALLGLGKADESRPAVELAGLSLRTRVLDNVIIAPLGIGAGGKDGSLMTAELDVRGNVLACRDFGITLEGPVTHLRGNRVSTNSFLMTRQAAMNLLGTVGPHETFSISGNSVLGDGHGIVVGGSGYDVSGNDLAGSEGTIERRAHGISVAMGASGALRGPTRITGNTVRDVGGNGISVEAPTSTLDISHNLVVRALQGIVVGGRSRSAGADVSHNTVREVGTRETDKADGVAGIQVVGALRASVVSNVVQGVGLVREAGEHSVGIRVAACPDVRVAGNSVDRVGFFEIARGDVGIEILGLLDRVIASGNTCRRQPSEIGEGEGQWVALLVGAPREEGLATVGGLVTGLSKAGSFAVGPQAAYVGERGTPAATVDTNILDGGRSVLPALLVRIPGDIVATGNQCRKDLDLETEPALFVAGGSATVNGNRCVGGLPVAAALEVDPSRAAVVANVVSSEFIALAGSPLPGPWDAFNVYNVN